MNPSLIVMLSGAYIMQQTLPSLWYVNSLALLTNILAYIVAMKWTFQDKYEADPASAMFEALIVYVVCNYHNEMRK